MYNIEQIRKKINRFYERGDIFRVLLSQEVMFPISIPLQKIKEADIRKDYSFIVQSIQKLEKTNLPLVYKEFSFKALGAQRLPVKIHFENLDAYLMAIDKKEEFEAFKILLDKITKKYPDLISLFAHKPFIVLDYRHVWDKLLAIVDFILNNPQPNIYIRELCIQGVDTKFIEKHTKIIDILVSNVQKVEPLNSLLEYSFEKKYSLLYPEPQIRFRILDERLYIKGLSDISLPLSQFQRLDIGCKKVFIVENKITTLSFPNCPDSIVIFGKGYGVSILNGVHWLMEKKLIYWGDIDLDGFSILSNLRYHFPHVDSFLMDIETYELFYNLGVYYPKREKSKTLLNLNDNETSVYNMFCKHDGQNEFRIEQERIPFDYLVEQLEGWF